MPDLSPLMESGSQQCAMESDWLEANKLTSFLIGLLALEANSVACYSRDNSIRVSGQGKGSRVVICMLGFVLKFLPK